MPGRWCQCFRQNAEQEALLGTASTNGQPNFNLPPLRDQDMPLSAPTAGHRDLNSESSRGTTVAHGSVDMGNGVFRNPKAVERMEVLPFPEEPNVNTLTHVLQRSSRLYADRPCYGERPLIRGTDGNPDQFGDYEFTTFADFWSRARAFGHGTRALCPWLPSPGTRCCMGLYGPNSLWYVIAQWGCYTQAMSVVPVYDTLSEDALSYVVKHAELSVAAVSQGKPLTRFGNICCSLKEQCPVRGAIILPHHSAQSSSSIPDFVASHEAADVVSHGLTNEVVCFPTKDNEAMIMYTSGSTGMPKGVMMSHAGVLACAAGLMATAGQGLGEPFCSDDRYLSFLPLAHGYENAVQCCCISRAVCVGFFKGDVRTLADDAKVLRPTMFAAVPRVYQRIKQVVIQGFEAKPPLVQQLIARAIRVQCNALREQRSWNWSRDAPHRRIWWADKLVFSKVREALGGRVRYMFTGGAPTAPELMDFFRVTFGATFCEGYGLTETCGAATAVHVGDPIPRGHVGQPFPALELKVLDVPELGYHVSDQPCPRGEVVFRGPMVMNGYYKDTEQTAEVLDEDGWFYTGDIGRINPSGTLTIIDRRKNIFKLAQGEYVAVEQIEGVLSSGRLVGQLFVHGESLKNTLVAIVVPDPIELLAFARKNDAVFAGLREFKETGWEDDFLMLCQSEQTKSWIMQEMDAAGKAQKLKGFEMVKAVHIEGKLNELNQGFSVDNNCLTPTFKLKRNELRKRYQKQIEALYLSLGDAA